MTCAVFVSTWESYSRHVPGKAREDNGGDGHDNEDNPG